MSADIAAAMNARMAAGEFGNPVDLNALNAAWAEAMDLELSKRGAKPIYNTISGLWAENSAKVAFSGRTKEDVHIPAGSKVMCFHNQSDNERAPSLNLVWVSYEA
jgi:hypothetical protein